MTFNAALTLALVVLLSSISILTIARDIGVKTEYACDGASINNDCEKWGAAYNLGLPEGWVEVTIITKEKTSKGYSTTAGTYSRPYHFCKSCRESMNVRSALGQLILTGKMEHEEQE